MKTGAEPMQRLAALAALTLAALALAPSARADAITDAQVRGRQIFDLDKAAWIATDELQRQVGDLRGSGISGWVVEGEGDALIVNFLRRGPAPSAAFIAEVRGDKVISAHLVDATPPTPLTPRQTRMVGALDAARQAAQSDPSIRPCGNAPFNSVVMPPSNDSDPIIVYLLTPQEKNGEYPFGGHYRLEIGADGKVISSRPFTKSCITLTDQGGDKDKVYLGLMITHLLDPQPTEIHVFEAITIGKPVYVITGKESLWSVVGGTITKVDTSRSGR